MMVEAAHRLNIPIGVLDAEGASATQLGPSLSVVGSFNDAKAIKQLASKVSVVTTEIEHVDVDALEGLENVHPHPSTIRLIQDKYQQKLYLSELQVPLGPFRQVTVGKEQEDLTSIGVEFGYPFMCKSKRMAYDGRGNFVIKSPSDIPLALKALKGELYAEKWMPFTKELAVMVAKGLDGQVVSYPCVETIQSNNICHLVIAPAQIDGKLCALAQEIAEQVVKELKGAGIYGVEMFLVNNEIYVNEIAPRPHNSGHYTIEACETSQFEQHLRCVLGLPLGGTAMTVPGAIMLNIIGKQTVEETMAICTKALTLPGATVHMYGKSHRLDRKMGHVTLVGDMIDLKERIALLTNNDISLRPIVGIIMGSDSDLPTLKAAAVILKGFDIPFELTIVSAHRTPERMVEYAKSAHERGIKVIIAAAGGAAHLPGMVAALTPLPVIGVPVSLSVLDGVDSLHSIVQMPRGVPVATVAINNSTNAALLATRILASHIPTLLEKLMDYQRIQQDQVMEKVDRLESIGWENYKVSK